MNKGGLNKKDEYTEVKKSRGRFGFVGLFFSIKLTGDGKASTGVHF